MAQDNHGYSYTIVLLENIPPYSEKTSEHTVQNSLKQFGYSKGLTNIESVRVVKGKLRSGAVYKLYKDGRGSEADSGQLNVQGVHILYHLMISDSTKIDLSESMAEVFSAAKDDHGHLLFRDVEDGSTMISGPPESVIAFWDFLDDKCSEAILAKPREAAEATSIDEERATLSTTCTRKVLSLREQSEYDGMSPDALSLLEKLPAGQIEGVHFDARKGRVLIDKETPEKEDQRISLFQTAYQTIATKKLKITKVPIPTTTPLDTVTKLIGAYNQQYDQCVFTLHEECVKIVSSSSRQSEQAVILLTKDMADSQPKCEVIQLPNARTLTLKKANIVTEEVDIIVNPANERLSHAGGVAAALDRASKGKLQKLSNAYFRQKGAVRVGCIAITAGGGDLKCQKVIHAVGPTASLGEANCEKHLKNVFLETLKGAEKYNAESIAFPAISTGIFGVKKELVARCLVDTILAYKIPKPHPVLSDIRIVIIDDSTYDPFALYFQQKQRKLMSPIKPAKFAPPKKSGLPAETGEEASPSVVETPDKKLSLMNDSVNIERLLKGLANDWRLLGRQLGFSKKALDKIASTPADTSVYLNKLLNKWLCDDAASSPTISKLVGALGGLKGAEEYVGNILAEFNDPPFSPTSANDGDPDDHATSYPDDHVTRHPDDDAVATGNSNSLGGASVRTFTDDGLTGESSVDKTTEEEDKQSQASSTRSSQEEHQQLDTQLPPSDSTTLSSLGVTTTALMSPVTMTTSPSPKFTPSPGLFTHSVSTPGGYNNGHPWGYTDGQTGTAMNQIVLGTGGSLPQFPFRGGSGAGRGSSGRSQPREQRPQAGVALHTLATRNPYPNYFEDNQARSGAVGMNYSGALTGGQGTGYGTGQGTGQGTGYGMGAGAAVTVQPQANTGHPGGGGRGSGVQTKEEDTCPICLSEFTDAVKTKCGHIFCQVCIDRALEHNSFCPTCKTALKTIEGNQPIGGRMDVYRKNCFLPGYRNCGTIEIQYYIPNGIQGRGHPNPGQQYTGTTRVAYLPDNPEGREVLKLLQRAFKAQLIFTVGTSVTSGQNNTVTWNDIHHKTNIHGGPQQYGYPDPGYLQRVKDDLAAKGIVPSREATI